MSKNTRGTPIKASDIQVIIDRNYREGGPLQWVRELTQNALEAKATNVLFTVHWPSAEAEGAYRRMVVDNGIGMNAQELPHFFSTYGGSGKQIGGIHENFGIGAKSSLLPWNKAGLVVISKKAGHEPCMIRVFCQEKTGEYCLEHFEVGGEYSEVVVPYLDEYGTDWSRIPEIMRDHGTAVILLGNDRAQHTVHNDPHREDSGLRSVAKYLNLRYYEFGMHDFKAVVHELNTSDVTKWPKSEPDLTRDGRGVHAGQVFPREIRGARDYVENPKHQDPIKSDVGRVDLSDGTKVHWFLVDRKVDRQAEFVDRGFIATIYKHELWEPRTHASHFSQFGIPYKDVSDRLWIFIEPREATEEDGPRSYGVYPTGDRNRLLVKPGSSPLPFSEWGQEFAQRLPETIQNALRIAQAKFTESDSDVEVRRQMQKRFASRWNHTWGKMLAIGTSSDTSKLADPEGDPPKYPKRESDKEPNDHKKVNPVGPKKFPKNRPLADEGEAAEPVKGPAIIPNAQWMPKEELSEPHFFAEWRGENSDNPNGLIFLNKNHPVLVTSIAYHQKIHGALGGEHVVLAVMDAYKQVIVSKAAHALSMPKQFTETDIKTKLLSPESLTFALLGYYTEDKVINDFVRRTSK